MDDNTGKYLGITNFNIPKLLAFGKLLNTVARKAFNSNCQAPCLHRISHALCIKEVDLCR